jgi:hypothetical protein
MPEFVEIRLMTADGSDAVCLRKDQRTGEFFCPVCGVRRTFAPYSEGLVGSQDICLCCDFQYGCDDKPGRTCQESWEKWRSYWLETEHKGVAH